jgi:IS30 family transposase
MKRKYGQLSQEQRYTIEAMLSNGYNQSQIAQTLGVHRSTISRELQRNVKQRGPLAGLYVAANAQMITLKRHRAKPKRVRFTEQRKAYVREKLKEQRWSPELISGRGKIEFGDFVSHETIYQYIWMAKKSHQAAYTEDKSLHTYLRQHGRRQKRKNHGQNRGCIPNRVSIEQRPAIVEQRIRLGDFEIDIMLGKERKPAALVITDRSSRRTLISMLHTKGSKEVANRIVNRLRHSKIEPKTLTFDNDLAFAKHENVAKRLSVETYFTRPYTSQDKGTVENRIGVIRRFIPKGTPVEDLSPAQIRSIENKINNRPMKMFQYLTPNEMFEKIQRVALIT